MRKYRAIIAWVVALALSLAIALVAGAALEPATAVTPQRDDVLQYARCDAQNRGVTYAEGKGFWLSMVCPWASGGEASSRCASVSTPQRSRPRVWEKAVWLGSEINQAGECPV